jgi:hypothetical protein
VNRKTAIFWPYLYDSAVSDLSWSWEPRYRWVAEALRREGFTVLNHPRFNCDLGESTPYEGEKECDIVIYNHCDRGEIRGDVIEAKHTWFFKPTVPDDFQTTLDTLGYGSYSSITYEKPDYLGIDETFVDKFFETTVKGWVDKNSSKWGDGHFSIEPENIEGPYALVVGQCGGDSVVNRQDFGSYFSKLEAVISELSKVYKKKIVVKLHPYTNGRDYKKGVDQDYIKRLTEVYQRISDRITVIGDFSSIHHYLPQCEFAIVGNSGAGFEAMMHHKPIISFCHPEYHWVTFDLRKICELERATVTEGWFDKEASDRFLYWYMRNYCFFDLDSAQFRVRELLDEEKNQFIKKFYADLSI